MTLITIPADQDFLAVLAQKLLHHHGDDPLALADVRVILPTRRAARTLATLMPQYHKGPSLMLPRLGVLGQMDDDDLALVDADGIPLAFSRAYDRPVWPPLRRLLVMTL